MVATAAYRCPTGRQRWGKPDEGPLSVESLSVNSYLIFMDRFMTFLCEETSRAIKCFTKKTKKGPNYFDLRRLPVPTASGERADKRPPGVDEGRGCAFHPSSPIDANQPPSEGTRGNDLHATRYGIRTGWIQWGCSQRFTSWPQRDLEEPDLYDYELRITKY